MTMAADCDLRDLIFFRHSSDLADDLAKGIIRYDYD